MAGNTAIQGGMRQEVNNQIVTNLYSVNLSCAVTQVGWRKIDEYMMEYFSTIVPNKMTSMVNKYTV